MTVKKFSVLLTFMVFLSVCIFSGTAWAADEQEDYQNNGQNDNGTNNGNTAKAFTLQDTSTFIGKSQGNAINNNHLVNTPTTIWAFITNNGQEQVETAPSDIDLTLSLKNSQGQLIGNSYHIMMKKGELSGSIDVVFPTSGQWQLSASGTINNNNDKGNGNGNGNGNSEVVSYTTNLFWVGPPLELKLNPPSQKISVGGTQQFQANLIYYVLGIPINLDLTNFVSWTSSNSSVASISQGSIISWSGGLATGLSPGKSTITANYQVVVPFLGNINLTATANLEVEKFEITPQNPKDPINIGETQQYVATLTDPDLQVNVVTNSATWKSLDSSVASVNNQGLATGVSSGTTTITATYNGLSASAALNVQKPTVDHFGFVDSTGSPTNPDGTAVHPNLDLRYDVDPGNLTHATWAYIGEPMHLDVYLQAYTKQGVPITDYIWDTQWFRSTANWIIVSSGSGIDTSKLSYSIISDPVFGGNSILHAKIEVTQGDATLNKVIQNFSLTVKPKDSPGISPLAPIQAVVPGQGTAYTLYGGQIRVAQSYFYQVTGKAQVYVEKFDDKFVQNKDDSLTFVSTWNLSGNSIDTQLDFLVNFRAGSGEVTVSNNTSNVSFTLKPIGYPAYLGTVPGTLTWGQIVDNPPPSNPLQQDEGPVWEKELLP